VSFAVRPVDVRVIHGDPVGGAGRNESIDSPVRLARRATELLPEPLPEDEPPDPLPEDELDEDGQLETTTPPGKYEAIVSQVLRAPQYGFVQRHPGLAPPNETQHS
jgi:hypothetical protein